MSKRIGCTLAIVALLGPVQAGTYKWVDADGGVHYGHAPPANQTAREIEPTHARASASATSNTLAERLKAFDERQAEREQSAHKQQAAAERSAVRQSNCDSARDNLSVLTTHGQVSVKEGDQYRRLPEEERQARITEAEQQIERFCKRAEN